MLGLNGMKRVGQGCVSQQRSHSSLIRGLLIGLVAGAGGFAFSSGTSHAIVEVPTLEPVGIVHECGDGIDNDGDGRVDHPDDPDCADAMDEAERRPTRIRRRWASFTPLELPEGYRYPEPTALSKDGSVIVGWLIRGGEGGSADFGASVVWRNRVPEIIDEVEYRWGSRAIGVSDDGSIVVGSHLVSNDDGSISLRAYRYSEGRLADLPSPESQLLKGLRGEEAFDVSDTGRIVGWGDLSPLRWDGGAPTIVGAWEDGLRITRLRAVTSDGAIMVGSSHDALYRTKTPSYWLGDDPTPIPLYRAVWDPNSRWSIGPPGHASDVSGDGSVIVGAIEGAPDGYGLQTVAMRWELGKLRLYRDDAAPAGGRDIEFHAIAADGSIASGTGSTSGAVVADRTRIRTLRDLLVNEYGLDLAGWQLDPDRGGTATAATAISGDGRTLVGVGVQPDGNEGVYLVRLPPACSDGLDNDGDGNIDHPEDPGCRSKRHDNESPECDDGRDNDGDGATDADDLDCRTRAGRREGCGRGFEWALVAPALVWSRRRRKSPWSRATA